MRLALVRFAFATSLAVLAACSSSEGVTEAPPPPVSSLPPVSSGTPDAGTNDGAPSVPPVQPPASAPPLPEATRAAVQALCDAQIDPAGQGGKSVGLTIGVWTPAFEGTVGCGRTRAGGNAPDGDTVYEIGSVTKVFTGMLLADRVLSGKMKLGDAASTHLVGLSLPTFEGAPITLAHLASHGAGLPSMPDNLTGDRFAPAAGYTRERLAEFLSRTALPDRPGTTYRYSNVGVGILGLALADASGKSFEAMVAETITGPLGMSDTRVDRASYPEARLAQGHQGATPIPPNRIDVLDASGALRSTGRDMLKLVAVHAGKAHALAPVAALTHEEVITKPQGGGCGLTVELREAQGTRYLEKSGATSGFTARVVATRSPALGVVVLANTANVDVNGLAQRVHDAARAP
ncbi:MAG: beta-lactamase family protein [Myxococcales bacterium]|nr:beta-lactamase family protein [Myxococcales bacterium]